jgi:hypothetical protein
VLNYQLIASVGATVASTVTYLLPVVAIILGFLVLGEHITLLDPAGIALILTEVALTRNRAVCAQTNERAAAMRRVGMSVSGNFRVRFGCLTGWGCMDSLRHAGWARR